MNQRRNKLPAFLIISAIVLYVVNLVIDNPYTHSLVNFYINEKFLSKIPISAEYQSMKVQLFPPSIHLFGVSIKDKPEIAPEGGRQDLLSTSQISFSLSPWSVFLARPQIGNLELHDLQGYWPPPQHVLDALKALTPPSKSSSKESFQWPPSGDPPLASIILRNANLRLTFDGVSINSDQDPNEQTSVSTAGADVFIDCDSWSDIRIRSVIRKLSLFDRGRSYLEDALVQLDGRFNGDGFTSSKMTVESNRLTTEGDVSFKIIRDKDKTKMTSIDAIISQKTTADFSLLGSFLDLGSTFGKISADSKINLSIPLQDNRKVSISVSGSGRSNGAVLDGFHMFDSEADFVIDLDGIDFKEVRIKSRTENFGKARGKLQFNNKLEYKFLAEPKNLPFDALLGVFNVPFDTLNFKVSSENLEILGTGTPFNMSVKADSNLNDFTTPTISYDHSKVPSSPTCKIKFDLRIDSSKIAYDGTGGICIASDVDNVELPLRFIGETTFNEKTGMDLSILSPVGFSPAPLSYFAQARLGGSGSHKTRIHGPYSTIQIDSNFVVANFSVEQILLGELSATTKVVDGKLLWVDTHIVTPDGGTVHSPSGSIKFNPDPLMEAKLVAKDVNPTLVKSILNINQRNKKYLFNGLQFGITSFDADLVGPLMRPLFYEGKVNFSFVDIRDDVQEFASLFAGQLDSQKKGFEFSGKASLGTMGATYNGTIVRTDAEQKDELLGITGLSSEDKVHLELKVPVQSSPKDQLSKLPFISDVFSKYGIMGTISGSAKLDGNFKKVSGTAKIDLDNARVLGASVPSVRSRSIINGSKVDLIAEQGGNALKGRMNVDFSAPGLPYDWYLTFKNLDVRPILPSVLAQDPRNFAYVNANWSMEGNLDNWWNSTGTFDIKSIRAKFFPPQNDNQKPLEVSSVAPVSIDIKQSVWSMSNSGRLLLKSEFGSVEIGSVGSRLPDALNVPIAARFELETLKTFIPSLEISTGAIQAKGGIFGSVSDPKIDLTITDTKISSETASTWHPISLGHADFRPAIKDVVFSARLVSGGIQIENFTGKKGGGTIESSGFVGFLAEGSHPTDLGVKLNDAAFSYPFPVIKNFDSVLDGNIQISGTGLPLSATGTVSIKRARSNRDIDIREAILSSIRSNNLRTGPNSLMPKIKFDVTVKADESISFNSRTIQANLSSNLRLGGSDISPEILGLIQVERGKFFYKRDFIIRQGVITYDDPIKPDPSLNINATSEVGGYRVAINISGRASEPTIDFSIDPPNRLDGTSISKLDIITLLSRGSLPEVRAAGISSAESTAAAEALNLLVGQVEDTVQKVFDLSGQNIIKQVYIDTYADTTGTPIARFNMPLNITEDLDLVLKVDQSTVKLSSEYALHDSISLTGGIESSNDEAANGVKRQGSPADTGVDVKFRFAFP
jgi:hypothetical protein